VFSFCVPWPGGHSLGQGEENYHAVMAVGSNKLCGTEYRLRRGGLLLLCSSEKGGIMASRNEISELFDVGIEAKGKLELLVTTLQDWSKRSIAAITAGEETGFIDLMNELQADINQMRSGVNMLARQPAQPVRQTRQRVAA
jgi:hypothetical protein